MEIPIVLEIVPDAPAQITLRCACVDAEVEQLLALLSVQAKRIATVENGETQLLRATEVLYCECVDARVYVYTNHKVCFTPSSLVQLEQTFAQIGFFRCSKSMVVNVHGITALRSSLNGRIVATLENAECLVISRHYAKALRAKLLLEREL